MVNYNRIAITILIIYRTSSCLIWSLYCPTLIVWNFAYFNIFINTPYVKFSTCSLIYSSKVSPFHRPIRLITITCTPDRNNIITPQDLIECKLMSYIGNSRFALLIKSTIALSLGNTCAKLICTAVSFSVVKLQFFNSLLRPLVSRTFVANIWTVKFLQSFF